VDNLYCLSVYLWRFSQSVGVARCTHHHHVDDVIFLAGFGGDRITKTYPSNSTEINEDTHIAREEIHMAPLPLYAKAKTKIERTLLGLKGSVADIVTVLRFATASCPTR